MLLKGDDTSWIPRFCGLEGNDSSVKSTKIIYRMNLIYAGLVDKCHIMTMLLI